MGIEAFPRFFGDAHMLLSSIKILFHPILHRNETTAKSWVILSAHFSQIRRPGHGRSPFKSSRRCQIAMIGSFFTFSDQCHDSSPMRSCPLQIGPIRLYETMPVGPSALKSLVWKKRCPLNQLRQSPWMLGGHATLNLFVLELVLVPVLVLVSILTPALGIALFHGLWCGLSLDVSALNVPLVLAIDPAWKALIIGIAISNTMSELCLAEECAASIIDGWERIVQLHLGHMAKRKIVGRHVHTAQVGEHLQVFEAVELLSLGLQHELLPPLLLRGHLVRLQLRSTRRLQSGQLLWV